MCIQTSIKLPYLTVYKSSPFSIKMAQNYLIGILNKVKVSQRLTFTQMP